MSKGKDVDRETPAGSVTEPPPVFSLCQACLQPSLGTPPKCELCGRSAGWAAMQNTKGMTLEALRRFGRSVSRTGPKTTDAHAKWVDSLARCVAVLGAEDVAQPELLSVFWIRLHGVLGELMEYMQETPLADVTAEELVGRQPQVRAAAQATTQAIASITHMRSSLSDDLHIYADWRRQVECHLGQSAYKVQVQGKLGAERRLKVDYSLKALGREVTVEDRWASITRVQDAHASDDELVARQVAGLIREDAEALVTAWQRLKV